MKQGKPLLIKFIFITGTPVCWQPAIFFAIFLGSPWFLMFSCWIPNCVRNTLNMRLFVSSTSRRLSIESESDELVVGSARTFAVDFIPCFEKGSLGPREGSLRSTCPCICSHVKSWSKKRYMTSATTCWVPAARLLLFNQHFVSIERHRIQHRLCERSLGNALREKVVCMLLHFYIFFRIYRARFERAWQKKMLRNNFRSINRAL